MEEHTLNEREFLERGEVSQKVWPSLRPYENRAVRSPDAQLPGPLPPTLRVGRLMGSSSTARQYNINVTEANACKRVDLHHPSAPSLHQACHICVSRRPEEFSRFSQLELRDMRMPGRPHQE